MKFGEAEWTTYPYRKELELPGFEVPAQYTVPYAWGNLRVTEAAGRAYGLVPLAEGVIRNPGPGLPPRAPDELWQLDIALTAPRETRGSLERVSVLSPQHLAIGMDYVIQRHKRGAAIEAAFTVNREHVTNFAQENLQAVAHQAGIDAKDLVDEDLGVPLNEQIARSVPQIFAHMLSDVLGNATSPVLEEILRTEDGRRFLKEVTRIGALVLAGEGILAAGSIAGNASAVETVATGCPTLGLGAVFGYALLRQYLQLRNRNELAIQQGARRAAEDVRNSLHNTFCTTHFDRHMEDMLNNSNEEDDR